MFIVVVIIFAVCWLPYHVYFIYTYHDTEIRRQPYIQHVYLGFYWLAMSNSMFNPLIYYWMNARSALKLYCSQLCVFERLDILSPMLGHIWSIHLASLPS